ncbi:TPA: polysaccharide deacetylase family protein [Methanocaldococcus jannaschii]|uniref:Putative alpha-amylase n=2 Tax=Methanocaldococcus jannaschii TaxID=2190 RepID=AMYA_METJA|nr:glycoside hydrolase family 57 protein [Methanocaldococcus jannaschii]Q59006.1 RecName: Full=Putative alpha-amylase [Methanocaldococcus jannaschii DSM 2661]AAB99631.1 alpha-amylase (amyA) [Methanocaldococcus jannaschii DSM 2661]HII59447.1 polysaccharide deacetylase family protein [Methanocaldococcus jannaschii]
MLITFNFEVHQPHRLNKEINQNGNTLWEKYVDTKLNKEVFNKVANKCYIPTNELILELIDEYDFKVNYSITGVFVEQALEFNDYVLDLFKDLVKTGNVELIAETYHHSLTSLFETEDEFIEDIEMHRKMYKEIFGFKAKVFRNTELIYNNRIAKIAKDLGFKAIFTEGIEKILGWRSPNYLYQSPDGMKILLRNYRLSDDIGFRFSARDWDQYPLTADKYAIWLASTPGEVINIYMDYETFGEHHWKETGIFEFLRYLPIEIAKHEHLEVVNVSEVVDRLEPRGEIYVHEFATISWADTERDVSAWLGNKMQRISFEKLKDIGKFIKENSNKLKKLNKFDEIYKMYKVLQTSDNLYYQSIKGLSDMSVHNYFSHFDTPFDAYASYLNILYDFEYYIKELLAKSEFDKNNRRKDGQKQYEKDDEVKKESLINTNIIVAKDDKTESIYIEDEEGKKNKRYERDEGFIIA